MNATRRCARETAIAFGDVGDRDYQAEFGAAVTGKASVSAKVGPKLPTASSSSSAPKATGGLSASLSKSLATVASSAKAAAAKPASGSTPVLPAPPKPATVKPSSLSASLSKSLAAVASSAKAAPAPKPAAPKPAASVKVSTPVLPAPPKPAAAKPAAPAKPAVSQATSAFNASAKAAPAKAPTSLAELAAQKAAAEVHRAPAAPAKPAAKASVATTAQTGNFLDAGAPALAAPSARPSDAALKAEAEKLAAMKAINAKASVSAAASKTATANLSYGVQRAADAKLDREIHERLMATDPAYAAREKSLASAKVDWGLIPAGAKILGLGAATVATGGLVAGALAVPSAGAIAGAAVAADRLVAQAEKAGVAPKGASKVTGAATAALDAGAKAKAVLDNTAKLAEMGVPEAIAGAKVIADTVKQRASSGALPGVPQAVTEAGAKAFANFAVNGVTPEVADALASTLSGRIKLSSPVVDLSKLKKATAATPAPAPAAEVLSVEWFVSDAGKVTRGKAPKGHGFRVYSNGQVVQQ